jgi:hypothetical protein
MLSVESCCRIQRSHRNSSGKPSVALYRHVRIGFADIAGKRPGLPLTGQLSVAGKVPRFFLAYHSTEQLGAAVSVNCGDTVRPAASFTRDFRPTKRGWDRAASRVQKQRTSCEKQLVRFVIPTSRHGQAHTATPSAKPGLSACQQPKRCQLDRPYSGR